MIETHGRVVTPSIIQLVSVVAVFLLTLPLAVEAQQAGKVWRIGWVNTAGNLLPAPFVRALNGLGWVEGKNIMFEHRYAALPTGVQHAADELVRSGVDIILTSSAGNAEQVLKVTRTIPVVVLTAGELGSSGLITSLRRPGGNLTGTQIYSPELMGKRLQLLKEILPISRMAILRPSPLPDGLVNTYVQMIGAAADRLGIRTRYMTFASLDVLDGLFAEMVKERDEALLVWSHPFTFVHRRPILDLATKNRLPVIGEFRSWAESGALLAYGPRLEDLQREAAGYVDKILRGAKPGDLPIQQPTTFEMVINLKTAKTLGLTIPRPLLLQADRVIE